MSDFRKSVWVQRTCVFPLLLVQIVLPSSSFGFHQPPQTKAERKLKVSDHLKKSSRDLEVSSELRVESPELPELPELSDKKTKNDTRTTEKVGMQRLENANISESEVQELISAVKERQQEREQEYLDATRNSIRRQFMYLGVGTAGLILAYMFKGKSRPPENELAAAVNNLTQVVLRAQANNGPPAPAQEGPRPMQMISGVQILTPSTPGVPRTRFGWFSQGLNAVGNFAPVRVGASFASWVGSGIQGNLLRKGAEFGISAVGFLIADLVRLYSYQAHEKEESAYGLKAQVNSLELKFELQNLKKQLSPENFYLACDLLEEIWVDFKEQSDAKNTSLFERFVQMLTGDAPMRGRRPDVIDQSIREKIKKLELIASLPVGPIIPKPLELVSKELTSYLSTFDADVARKVKAMAFELHANVYRENLELAQNSHYFFEGQAGTGKTETARKLAQILGVPFCSIDAARLKVEDLVGDRHSGLPGRILDCLIHPDKSVHYRDKRGKNTIIFFDEIHDALNSGDLEAKRLYSQIKLLTEQTAKPFKDDGTGIYADLNYVTFILAGNTGFQYDPAGAFMTRLTPIQFGQIDPNEKFRIAQQTFLDLARVYSLDVTPYDEDVIEAIAHFDPFAGARILRRVIQAYVLYQQAIQRGFKPAHELFDIKEEFARYTPAVAS